jgi:galactokinase
MSMTSNSPSVSSPSLDLREQVAAVFEQHFQAPPLLQVQAPGRVNLIGEHTDYNDGFVLPCAIDFQTVVAASPRTDGWVRVVAVDYDEAVDAFDLAAPITPRTDAPWANYVRGVLSVLLARHPGLPGANLVIAGNVPQGAGLSSSASLEVAVAQAFKSLFQLDALSPTDLALIGQQAENQFVGCQCGIMDQLISARGQSGHALLIDCRDLQAQAVPLPPHLAVMIVHSGVERGLVESEYNQRRQQCEAAAHHFGVPALRDLTEAVLAQDLAQTLDPKTLRRARHVVTENARTLAAAQALQAQDMPRLSELMAASHASMRDDFEITVPAIDQLVHLIAEVVGHSGGVRMTGGGFGGCVVALVPQEKVTTVKDTLAQHYRSPKGQPALVYVCHPAAGAGVC